MTNDEITIGILAGGKARRMNNADKGLAVSYTHLTLPTMDHV